MAYQRTGVQALFPVYFSRKTGEELSKEEFDISVAQHESNLNQNLETLYQKLQELEDYLASAE